MGPDLGASPWFTFSLLPVRKIEGTPDSERFSVRMKLWLRSSLGTGCKPEIKKNRYETLASLASKFGRRG